MSAVRDSKGKDVALEEDPIKGVSADNDDAHLANLGLAPSKLQRNFNIWSLMFMAFCTTVTWEAITSAVAQAMIAGGSSSLVWGFVASSSGAFIVVLCIAEYASMVPTAGGQYHYISLMAPPKYSRILSWYGGWMTIIGWILSALAGTFATAMQIQSWIVLFSPGYEYQRWHTSLIVIGLTTFYTLFSIFDIKHIHNLMFFVMFFHVAGYIAVPAYLLATVESKNSATQVFSDVTNMSGWENPGLGWLIGLLSTAIGFVGWDSPIHMAEEMANATRDLPRSLLYNIGVSALATFPWVIAFAFCVTDVATVLSGPVGTMSFMAQLFYNVSGGSPAATICLTMFLPVMGFCGVGPAVITSTSRVIWSFARDRGLPSTVAHVSSRTKTPIAALITTWAGISALALIYVGNDTAYYGLTSACTVALILSYAFPLFVVMVWGFRHCSLPRGVFTLGRYHRAVATVGFIWCIFLSIMMCFPVYKPVTAGNMNYASVVVFGGMLVATVCWWAYGRKSYIGLIQTLEAET